MKQIPLTQGKFALVDDEDFDWLSQWKWSYLSSGYAVRQESRKRIDTKKMILMHRLIIQTPSGMETDHKDLNRLNNQKFNLRIVTRAQNAHNLPPQKNSSSKYKGVFWAKRERRWVAAITVSYKKIGLGYYTSEQDAALAYNNAAIKYFGEFARINAISS